MSLIYNEAEGGHTLYSDWSTCTVFYTPESNLMQPTEGKLTTLAITTVAIRETLLEKLKTFRAISATNEDCERVLRHCSISMQDVYRSFFMLYVFLYIRTIYVPYVMHD